LAGIFIMKTVLQRLAQIQALIFCLLLPLQGRASAFVELTVEIEANDWDYWFFSDRIGRYPGEEGVPSIFTKSRTTRCVVGADTWLIESEFPSFKNTWWFTGTNIIAHTLVTKETPAATAKKEAEHSQLAMTAPPAGHDYTKVHESADGNPSRPGGVADLMGFDLSATVSWLAFCSGPSLKREGRQIFPPSAFWKESSIVYSGWSDLTEVFEDGLGLPKKINLVSTNGQSIFQYQVRQSTNVLGWSFPLEFYGVQYLPTATNSWKLHLTLKGRVTAIGACAKPEIPEEVMKVFTNVHAYHLRAGGPHSIVTITNAPASNPVAIAFAAWGDSGPIFRLTNQEPHAILLWNVRVQTRSKDAGTDGFGWDTVYDDYPMGTAKYNAANFLPGAVGEFRVQHPGKTPWRVCVLYSTDWTDSGKSYSGNYEVIGQELEE